MKKKKEDHIIHTIQANRYGFQLNHMFLFQIIMNISDKILELMHGHCKKML